MSTKKRFKKLKSSAIGRIKQLKSGRMGLQMKMFLLLSAFALMLGAVNIFNMVIGAKFIFRNHFSNQLTYLTASAKSDIFEGATSVEHYFDKMEQNHGAEVDSLRSGNSAPLAHVVDEMSAAAAYYGYYILTPDGTIMECTDGHAGLEKGLKADGVIKEMKEGRQCGYAEVADFGLCSVVSRTIYMHDGETPAAVVGIILSNLDDTTFLEGMKSRYQIEMALVKKGSFAVSTIKDEKGQPVKGLRIEDEAVTDSLYKSHVKFVGMSEVDDRSFSVNYTPLIGETGDLQGVIFTGIEMSRSNSLMKLLVLAMFLGGLLLSTLVIFLCFRHVRLHITLPIRNIAEAARRVAEKDLTQEIKLYDTRDEIELMAASVYDMQESLRETIEEVQDAALSLQTQSQEISRASMSISDGANRQASDLEEIASSVEEMTSIILQNTDNSKKTEKLMTESDKAIANIAEISSDSIAASKKIATSIRNINALVSQTNILSLNASVEAARAGSHGKGFAVVAREVGRLAEQTKMTAASVSETAEASIGAAMDVDSKLDEVTPQLRMVVDLMKEITVSSIEQGQGAEHINAAIADLNKTTQHNAAGAEELAASAEELASSAEELNEVVSRFKVK